MRLAGLGFALVALVLLGGCVNALIKGVRPDGSKLSIMFYPGGGPLKDLMILDGRNYFGKAYVSTSDPLADIRFRLENGQRLRAVCRYYRMVKGERDKMVKKCSRYEITRSSFPPIPRGTVFSEPIVD
jgi:hypothetical protein